MGYNIRKATKGGYYGTTDHGGTYPVEEKEEQEDSDSKRCPPGGEDLDHEGIRSQAVQECGLCQL